MSVGGAPSSEPKPFVLDLAEVGPSQLSLVGGKAGNLGELIRAKLPVPPGFCVTTEAYREVAAEAALDFDALATPTAGDAGRLARAARDALLAVPVPDAIARAVRAAYARLGGSVAVRSSATAEDLAYASFAGQQDTYLSVRGEAEVLDAVRRCWASLWTERAVMYRSSHRIPPRSVRLAVVVQRMVDARIAGVLFTANPVSGKRREAVIDASPGLGEAVVSGTVNPDHFVVDSERRKIVERRLGDKRIEVRALPGGGTELVTFADRTHEACVSDAQVLALAALGERVERHYGSPQDTEWAFDAAGELWLTQARPITTLFPIPQHPHATVPPRELRANFCFSVAQGLERPITPMGRSAFRLLSSHAERLFGFRADDPEGGAHVYAEGGQRLFIDLTGVLRGSVGRTLMPRVLDVMEARSAAVLRDLCEKPEFSRTERSPLGFLRRVSRIITEYGVPLRVARALRSPEWAHEQARSVGEDVTRRLQLPASASSAERLDAMARALGSEVLTLAPKLLPLAASGLAMLALAGWLLGDDASMDELQTVLRGLPHNVTTEMDLELWRLSQAIRRDESGARSFSENSSTELARHFRAGSLPAVAQRGLTEFLACYGHRAVAEIDLGMPRWSDDPEHILGVLANYLRLENPESSPDTVFARGAREAEATIETLVARARERGPVRAALVGWALDRARRLSGLREIPKYYIVAALAEVRRSLGVVGAELEQRGSIETRDDIFFLELAEARAALAGGDYRALVAERRQAYEAELHRRHVPRVILSDGTEPEALSAKAPADGALIGTPASAGSVTAKARVILDPVGAHIEPGEILVAPSTDPGWTPLFLTAGGLVMEMGGANSHGAVVAREYGIPAVVGAAGATRRIETGQTIRLDGSTGFVALAESGRS